MGSSGRGKRKESVCVSVCCMYVLCVCGWGGGG